MVFTTDGSHKSCCLKLVEQHVSITSKNDYIYSKWCSPNGSLSDFIVHVSLSVLIWSGEHFTVAWNHHVALVSIVSPFAQELMWRLSPLTPVSWLNIYMQVAYLKESEEVLIPQYPQTTFVQIAEVRLQLRFPATCMWFMVSLKQNALKIKAKYHVNSHRWHLLLIQWFPIPSP